MKMGILSFQSAKYNGQRYTGGGSILGTATEARLI